MKLRNIGLLILTMLLAGCWQKSVHPFYTDADLVTEPKLAGTWTQQKEDKANRMVWFFHDPTNRLFELSISNDKEKFDYVAHVFRLDAARYLDILSAGPREVSTMPVHHLFKIDELGTTLKITPLNIDWVQRWLATNPGALAHVAVADPEHREDRGQDELVLTADAKALQSFIRAHLKDHEFWGETVTLGR